MVSPAKSQKEKELEAAIDGTLVLSEEKERAYFFEKCKNERELKTWIKYFLDLSLPDTTVSRFADCNPQDMIWDIYNKAVLGNNQKKVKDIIYLAARGAGKTLGLAISEFLCIVHAHRDVAHIGVILPQAERCYDYFKSMIRKPRVARHLLPEDKASTPVITKTNMKKTEFIFPNRDECAYEILPCTMQALNGKHSDLVSCVGEGTKIVVLNENNKRERINVEILYQNIQKGYKYKALSYNIKRDVHEFKEITNIKNMGLKNVLRIDIDFIKQGDGVYLTPDHKVFDYFTKEYKEIETFNVGDLLLKPSVKESQASKREALLYFKELKFKHFNTDEQFEQVLLGSLLGDGGVYKRYRGSKSAGYQERHGESQIEYALWKKRILSHKLDFYENKQNTSGYTGKKSGIVISSKASDLLLPYCTFKNEDTTYVSRVDSKKAKTLGIRRKPVSKSSFDENIINKIDRLALAVWYMDDGSRNKINTQGFSIGQQNQLIKILKNKFNINMKIIKDKKYFCLAFCSVSDQYNFYKIIKDYLHPTMRYKLQIKEEYKKSFSKIKNIKRAGEKTTYDLTVKDNHNFLIANSAGFYFYCRNCDEIETADKPETLKAFNEIEGIIDSRGGKLGIRIGISTRKSRFGLMNRMIEEAEKAGRTVKRWTALEFTQRCLKDRYGEGNIDVYVNQDDMYVITKKEYDEMLPNKQKAFVHHKATSGCAVCPAFSICYGDLKKQTSKSNMLKPVEDLIQKVRSGGVNFALSQLVNLKPSMEGIVYNEYDPGKHLKSWDDLWEKLTGKKYPKGNCTHDIFVQQCKNLNLTCVAGVDFGFSAPSTLVVAYIDRKDNVYIVRAVGETGINDATWVQLIKDKYHRMYGVSLYYPDVADPSAIQIMQQNGLPIAKDIDKSINLGIQTIKRFLRVPGSQDVKLFIAKETAMPLADEMTLYHYKMKADGTISEIPDTDFNHFCDGLKYLMLGMFSNTRPLISTGEVDNLGPMRDSSGAYHRAPTAEEYATENNLPFNDNKYTGMEGYGKIGTLNDLNSDEDDEEKGGGKAGGGVNFVF